MPMNKPEARRPMHEEILKHCSAGPWQHGIRVLPFSADSQPCVYGDERELPLAMLDDDDQEASTNVVLMSAAWELCRELGMLVDAALAAERKAGIECRKLHDRCNRTLALLSRIHSDVQQNGTEKRK
jgi:hypothetical protein